MGVRAIGGRSSLADLYHAMLRVSWPMLCLLFAASFILFNLVFALLYSFDEAGIFWGRSAGSENGVLIDPPVTYSAAAILSGARCLVPVRSRRIGSISWRRGACGGARGRGGPSRGGR